MFCKNCGQKVEKVGKFCENCGQETGVDIEKHNLEAKIDERPTANSKMTKKQKVILSSILGVLLILFAISKIGQNLTSPEYVAKHYFEAISKANYESAYDFILLPTGDYVTKENFSQYMTKKYGSTTWTENYKLESNANSQRKSAKSNEQEMLKTINISYIDKDSSSQSNMYIKLVRLKTKRLFLFDDWKVSLNDEMQKEWKISVPKGASLFVNGKQVPKENVDRERNMDYYNSQESAKYEEYLVKNIFPGEYDLKVTIPGGKEYQKKNSSSYSVNVNTTADENLTNTIKDIVQRHNKDIETFVKSKDMSVFKETVSENSDAWKEILNFNTATYEEITGLTISLDKFQEMSLEDDSHVKAKVTAKWNATKKDYSGNDVSYENSEVQTYYLKKVNDKWVIYNID